MSVEERSFLKKIKENDEVMYMWEDKGPSFTKIEVGKYIQAGERELGNSQFYEHIDNDHFLQPGIAGLPTFLKDTKHTLQLMRISM